MIKVRGLKKSFQKIEAIRGIDFDVKEGSFFAFLGPNGAGKSTTINILTTLLEKSEGEVSLNGYVIGKDDDQIRKSIGVVFQHPMLDGKLTVRQNLNIRGSFYNLTIKERDTRIKSLVELLHIDYLDQAYQTLSGGQRRKADIARALIHQPKILFLDEPTTGLDPKTRQDVWRVIETLKRDHMTIFLTTHYMEEASQADHIMIINKGMIAAYGTPDQLKQSYAKDKLRLSGHHDVIIQYLKDKQLQFIVKNDVIEVETVSLAAIPIIDSLRLNLTGFEMIQSTLDDVFLDIIGAQTP